MLNNNLSMVPQVKSLFMGQIVSPEVKEVSVAIASLFLFRRPGNRDNLDLPCLPARPLSSLSSSLLSASSLMEQRPSIRNSKDLRILPLSLFSSLAAAAKLSHARHFMFGMDDKARETAKSACSFWEEEIHGKGGADLAHVILVKFAWEAFPQLMRELLQMKGKRGSNEGDLDQDEGLSFLLVHLACRRCRRPW